MSDAFFLKELFYPCLEGTVIIAINGHRKTHFVETLFHRRQCDWSRFFFHRDDVCQLAEDVNDHQPVSRFVVLGDYKKPSWNYLLKIFVNICGKCGKKQMKFQQMENKLLEMEKQRMEMFMNFEDEDGEEYDE